VIPISNVENFSGVIKHKLNINDAIEEEEPSESVREVGEKHMGFIFEIVLFFKGNVITRRFIDQVSPKGSF